MQPFHSERIVKTLSTSLSIHGEHALYPYGNEARRKVFEWGRSQRRIEEIHILRQQAKRGMKSIIAWVGEASPFA